MAYSIISYSGSHRLGSAEKRKAGKIESPEDLESFIDEYRRMKHDFPFLILSRQMNALYAAWQVRHHSHLDDGRKNAIGRLFNLAFSALTANPHGMLSSVQGMWGDIASELIYESQQPSFLVLERHWREDYHDGSVGFCLGCNHEGGSYLDNISNPNARTGAVIIALFTRKRPV